MITTARGAKTYNTGKPCKSGHTERYESSRNCVVCARQRALDARWVDPDSSRKYAQRYRATNIELLRKRDRLRDKNHRNALRRSLYALRAAAASNQ